ncbi:DNA cytosine methyltransferase [Microcella flavibacter]|uniref:DNA cytosine methyltransferase n=1 Tax=Microcella flavibacter TaxID=1804990 RepID=UPI001456CB96|nr:DNA cytosine methyltransferase [Microcella flavibacter]
MRNGEISVLDLFAGAGGLTAGFHSASTRYRSIAAVEWDAAAAASYEATFGEGIMHNVPIQEWLKNGDVPDSVDVIVGGPPCQGFSTLGKRVVEDERNSLWEQYEETILRTDPKYFVVENVAAFSKSPQFEQFLASTEPGGRLEGYQFEHWILNAADYGAPQARKRAVMIGRRSSLPLVGAPPATHIGRHATVADAFAGVPTDPRPVSALSGRTTTYAGKEFAGSFIPSELHIARDYAKVSMDRFQKIPKGGNRFDLPDDLLAPCWRGHRSGSADVMGRMHWDRPSVTIRTEFFKPEKGRYLHPEANRAITHYEAARLQGFSEDHRFVGSRTAIARQIGNAVPVQLAAAIARHLEPLL